MNLESKTSRSNHNLDIPLVPFFFSLFVFLLPKRPVDAKNVPLGCNYYLRLKPYVVITIESIRCPDTFLSLYFFLICPIHLICKMVLHPEM